MRISAINPWWGDKHEFYCSFIDHLLLFLWKWKIWNCFSLSFSLSLFLSFSLSLSLSLSLNWIYQFDAESIQVQPTWQLQGDKKKKKRKIRSLYEICVLVYSLSKYNNIYNPHIHTHTLVYVEDRVFIWKIINFTIQKILFSQVHLDDIGTGI